MNVWDSMCSANLSLLRTKNKNTFVHIYICLLLNSIRRRNCWIFSLKTIQAILCYHILPGSETKHTTSTTNFRYERISSACFFQNIVILYTWTKLKLWPPVIEESNFYVDNYNIKMHMWRVHHIKLNCFYDKCELYF